MPPPMDSGAKGGSGWEVSGPATDTPMSSKAVQCRGLDLKEAAVPEVFPVDAVFLLLLPVVCIFPWLSCKDTSNGFQSHSLPRGFPSGSYGKESACKAGDMGSFPG